MGPLALSVSGRDAGSITSYEIGGACLVSAFGSVFFASVGSTGIGSVTIGSAPGYGIESQAPTILKGVEQLGKPPLRMVID